MTGFPIYYRSSNQDFTLLHGDNRELLKQFEFKFDMVFADPPYFLSNGGKSISSGKIVSVDKGEWDKANSIEDIDSFNEEWLQLCYNKLKAGGTIWVSGTFHNIFSVGHIMQKIGYKILNIVTWQKSDAPKSIYDTHFQFASEHIIWAKKEGSRHCLNSDVIKELNDGRMLNDVWKLPAVQLWEKKQGKHTTQKPLSLLSRIILSCTRPGDWVLDPFAGSGTTGVAASLLNRRFCGIEQMEKYCSLAKDRREEIEKLDVQSDFLQNIYKDIEVKQEESLMVCEDYAPYYRKLPF